MNVQIQSVKFDADRKLKHFIREKLNKLDRFVDNAISAAVILKIDKDDEHGDKTATITLDIPGSSLVAERHGKSFEEAVDLSIDALKSQIEKHREKY